MEAPVECGKDRSVKFNSIAVHTHLSKRNVRTPVVPKTSCKGKLSSVAFSECSHNSLVSVNV